MVRGELLPVGPHWVHAEHLGLYKGMTREELKNPLVKVYCPYCAMSKHGIEGGMVVTCKLHKEKNEDEPNTSKDESEKDEELEDEEEETKGKMKKDDVVDDDLTEGESDGIGSYDSDNDRYSDPEMNKKWKQTLNLLPLDPGLSADDTRKIFDHMQIKLLQRQQRDKHFAGL